MRKLLIALVVFQILVGCNNPPVKLWENLTAEDGNQTLFVRLGRVYPWCDHMPVIGPEEHRQYLVANVTIQNKEASPKELVFSGAIISFGKDDGGKPVEGLSICDEDGQPTGNKKVVVPANSTILVELRGDGLYAEGLHDKDLYLTLIFRWKGHPFGVKNFGKIRKTI